MTAYFECVSASQCGCVCVLSVTWCVRVSVSGCYIDECCHNVCVYFLYLLNLSIVYAACCLLFVCTRRVFILSLISVYSVW